MILQALTPGTTIKFPLSVKMSTVKQQKNECCIETGPLALTLVNGKNTSAIQLDWVPMRRAASTTSRAMVMS